MRQFKLTLTFLLILTAFFACNKAKETKSPFVLSGTLEGISDGKIMLSSYSEHGPKQDSAIIKEGKFVIKGDYPLPTKAYLQVAETRAFSMIYVENTKMTLTGNVNDFQNAIIRGSKAQDEFEIYKGLMKDVDEKSRKIMEEFYKPGIKDARKLELEKQLEELNVKKEAVNLKYIKENPTAHHTAVLVSQQVSGKSAKETQRIIKGMAPEIQKNPSIVKLLADVAKKSVLEVGIDELMAKVKNVSYKVDEKFQGKDLKDVIYLGLMSNNDVCALKKDGAVEIVTPSGKLASSFKPVLNGQASSLAIDTNDDIYVMCGIMEKVVKKVRGRSIERMMPKGVECTVFNAKGEKKTQFKCEGLLTATGARIVENNLVIADYRGAKLVMFDKTNGKVGPTMDGMRPCCGILDFSVNEKKEILVANLGAFRVQGFDFTGKSILAFGQRGKELNDFHGCCNPVSVANLSSGAIVTVEKDPTRIKIYSQKGASQIAGIEELVKGCSYIPMIVDSKDNLYLASGEKGMVKCVSIN